MSPRAELPRKLSRRSPKGEQLRAILEDLIDALAPGDPLPSERELAERYDVARMTVRAEITALAAEGRVERVQGRGTFVAEARVARPRRCPRSRRTCAPAASSRAPRSSGRASSRRTTSSPAGSASTPARRRPRAPGAQRRRRADGPGRGVPTGRPLRRAGRRGPRRRIVVHRVGRALRGPLPGCRPAGRRGRDRRRGRQPAARRARARWPEVPHHLAGRDERPLAYAWSLFRGDRYEIRLRQERRA